VVRSNAGERRLGRQFRGHVLTSATEIRGAAGACIPDRPPAPRPQREVSQRATIAGTLSQRMLRDKLSGGAFFHSREG
jgi:hypothetical protein